jgi:hypothetical protein
MVPCFNSSAGTARPKASPYGSCWFVICQSVRDPGVAATDPAAHDAPPRRAVSLPLGRRPAARRRKAVTLATYATRLPLSAMWVAQRTVATAMHARSDMDAGRSVGGAARAITPLTKARLHEFKISNPLRELVSVLDRSQLGLVGDEFASPMGSYEQSRDLAGQRRRYPVTHGLDPRDWQTLVGTRGIEPDAPRRRRPTQVNPKPRSNDER